MNILEGWEIFYFKGDFLGMFHVHVQLKGAEKRKIFWDMRFQDSMVSNIHFLKIWFALFIFWLPDIIQIFCTPFGAMDLILQMKYIPSKFVLNLMEILIIKKSHFFFEAPCMFTKISNDKRIHCWISRLQWGGILQITYYEIRKAMQLIQHK